MNKHNIKQKRRPFPVINLYPERDVLMNHTNNIATGKPNVPQTLPRNDYIRYTVKKVWLFTAKKYVIGDRILIESRKTYLTAHYFYL